MFGALPSSTGLGRMLQFGTASPSTSHSHVGMRFRQFLLRPFTQSPSYEIPSEVEETPILLLAITPQILAQLRFIRDSLIPAILLPLHLSDKSKVGSTCMPHHAARVSKKTPSTFASTPKHVNLGSSHHLLPLYRPPLQVLG